MAGLPPVTPFTVRTTDVMTPAQYRGASSFCLWRWNETDLNQFDQKLTNGTATCTVALATDFPGNVQNAPCIKFTPTALDGGSATCVCVLPIKQSELIMPTRFVMQFTVDHDAGDPHNIGMIYHYQDFTHWLGESMQVNGTSTFPTIADNAAPVDSPTDFGNNRSVNGVADEPFKTATIQVEMRYVGGAPPDVNHGLFHPFEYFTTSPTMGRLTGSVNWGANWDSINARRGAVFLTTPAAAGEARIRHLAFYAHPLDLWNGGA